MSTDYRFGACADFFLRHRPRALAWRGTMRVSDPCVRHTLTRHAARASAHRSTSYNAATARRSLQSSRCSVARNCGATHARARAAVSAASECMHACAAVHLIAQNALLREGSPLMLRLVADRLHGCGERHVHHVLADARIGRIELPPQAQRLRLAPLILLAQLAHFTLTVAKLLDERGQRQPPAAARAGRWAVVAYEGTPCGGKRLQRRDALLLHRVDVHADLRTKIAQDTRAGRLHALTKKWAGTTIRYRSARPPRPLTA